MKRQIWTTISYYRAGTKEAKMKKTDHTNCWRAALYQGQGSTSSLYRAENKGVGVLSVKNLETVTKPLKANLLFIISMHQQF